MFIAIFAFGSVVALAGGGLAVYKVAISGMEGAAASREYLDIACRVCMFYTGVVLITFPIVAI